MTHATKLQLDRVGRRVGVVLLGASATFYGSSVTVCLHLGTEHRSLSCLQRMVMGTCQVSTDLLRPPQ